MNNLQKRILTSFIIFPLSIFFVVKGGYFLTFFLIFVLFAGMYELFSVFKKIKSILFLSLILILSLYSTYYLRESIIIGELLLYFAVAVSISSDIGGYVFGKVFKWKKLTKISPNKTKKSKKITLNLALNYGSKEEIITVCRRLAQERNKRINVKNFEEKLYTANIPDPEILIRTGGTKRLSNFLLWQLAYTEIFFIDKLWPEFNQNDFNKIINKFHKIKRNFGKI